MSDTFSWNEKWAEIQPLGGGGQGDTILVKSLSGETPSAVLKLLKTLKAQDAKARGRMALEVTNLKFLRSAGAKVPQVLDSNTEKFEDQAVSLFFVMEFIQGNTLAKTVQNSDGLSVETSVRIALDLCATMQIAIKEGIIHRDIKPENIILRNLETPDVVMVDFGLSFNEDEDFGYTSADESLDNKFLSLPERRGPGENKRDFRSDLTGICAILFYCLTKCSPRNLQDSQGRPPHRWPDYSLAGKIQDPNHLAALNLFFSRGFSNEIDSRFQTVDELISRLEEIIKPASEAVTEDLAVVVARETAALRKNDRKTQLSVHYQNSLPLQQSLNQCLNDLVSKMANGSFSIGFRQNLTTRMNEKCVHGDIVARAIIALSVQNHHISRWINYAVISQGSECAIYRGIEEVGVNGLVNSLEPLSVVCRYSGESNPIATAVVADMKVTVTKSIVAISQKIQAGY